MHFVYLIPKVSHWQPRGQNDDGDGDGNGDDDDYDDYSASFKDFYHIKKSAN